MNTERLLAWYYAATAVFLVLDYAFDLNIRIAFLEPWPAARLGYYGLCFACLAAIILRPAWTNLVSTVESLVTVIALILSLSVRVMIPNDAIFEENVAIVTTEELLNFLISGFAAYFAYVRGMKALKIR